MIIKLDLNGNPTGYPIDENNFRQLFPHVSFPIILLPQDVERFGYGMYEFSQKPVTADRYKKIIEDTPQRDPEGYWRQRWSIVDQTEEEREQTDAIESTNVRSIRNAKLSQSDWTRLDDAALSSEKRVEWATYRQLLRDITDQDGFPHDINWPTPPA